MHRGTRGHAHREGGLGHLAAVVCDAPAEAAWDASAVVLLLAAHHRLHGVAAHPDGSLQPEGTRDSRSSPPCGALTPNPLPAPGTPKRDLSGYLSSTFESQLEVKRFLEATSLEMSNTVPMVHGHQFAAGSRAHGAAGRVALGCTGAPARTEPQPMPGPWLPQ